MAINFIVLSGRLTAAPELKSTTTGIPACGVTLAVDRSYGDNKETDFIPCKFWRKSAETLAKYCNKGSKITVTGTLQSRTYQDRDGNNRTIYEVQVDRLELPPKESRDSVDAVDDADAPPLPFDI